MQLGDTMNFREGFFHKEAREGFEISSLMKRCWAAQLELLEQFDGICRRCGLRYYAAYGTLLGAVRHGGFIPWDDDIDIWMYGEDVDRMIREMSSEFEAEGLELVTPFSDDGYENLAFRVINTRNDRLDEEFLMKYWLFPFMAGLDIFPLNFVPEKEEERQLIKTLMASANILACEWKKADVPNEDKWEAYTQLTDMLGIERVPEDRVPNQLWQLTDRISSLYGKNDSNMVAALPFYFEDPRKIFSMDWFGEPVYMEFEGVGIPCPSDSGAVLRAEFGDDYMVPKRIYETHDYPYYKARHQNLMLFFERNGIKCPEIYREL